MEQVQREQDTPQFERVLEDNLAANMKTTLGCLAMNIFFFSTLGIPLDRLNLLLLLWEAGQNWLASSGMKEKSLKKVERAFLMMIGFLILLLISLLRDIQESRYRRQSSNGFLYFHLFRFSCFVVAYFYPLIKTRSTLRDNTEANREGQDYEQFERNENGEETSVHKYGVLISGIWVIQSQYSNSDDDNEDFPEIEGFTYYLLSIAEYGMMILDLWHIVNCGLVFEGMRRKSLKLIQYSIKSMETYSIAFMVVYFFGFANEIFREMLDKRSTNHNFFDVSPMNWKIIVAVVMLVWRLYYHLVYLYGAQKVRDALKAHERLRHSL